MSDLREHPRPVAMVVLNPAARGGRGRKLWARVERAVAEKVIPRLVEIDGKGTWQEKVGEAVSEGTCVFIAAGGDGTVNALVNALVDTRQGMSLESFTLGAVGLGSSNDFHKPYGRVVAGIPLQVETAGGGRRDVGVARYVAPDGTERVRCFAVSASLGITAEANAFFNQGDLLLRALKGFWTGGAILYAALRTITAYRNIPASLQPDREAHEVAITNLSIMKTPFLSGSFRFDTPVEPDDGLFAVNLCEGMARREMVQTLWDLGRGRFLGKTGRLHWRVANVQVEARALFALELDGEVFRARRVLFEVFPEKIGTCR